MSYSCYCNLRQRFVLHPDPTMLEIYDWLNNAGVGQFTMHSGLQCYTIPLGKVFKYVIVMRYDITGAGKREGVAGERWERRISQNLELII